MLRLESSKLMIAWCQSSLTKPECETWLTALRSMQMWNSAKKNSKIISTIAHKLVNANERWSKSFSKKMKNEFTLERFLSCLDQTFVSLKILTSTKEWKMAKIVDTIKVVTSSLMVVKRSLSPRREWEAIKSTSFSRSLLLVSRGLLKSVPKLKSQTNHPSCSRSK